MELAGVGDIWKIDKLEERAVILQRKGLTPKAIHDDINTTLGKEAPSYAIVQGGQQNLGVAGRIPKTTLSWKARDVSNTISDPENPRIGDDVTVNARACHCQFRRHIPGESTFHYV